MLYNDSYLLHYGITGQKWGVRRFQNLDRTRTEEGKLRYRESLGKEFEKAEREVREKTSNRYSPFKKKPIDLDVVKARGNLSQKEAIKCVSFANKIFERASADEPQITRDVVSAVSRSGGEMFGLENRLKQPTSLAAKIGQEANENNVSFSKAADSIKDAIRYTSVSNDRDFTKNYEFVKNELKKAGYSEVRCRNYFESYRQGKAQHKSVQCIFEDDRGNKFELQFQTPSSQAAKELKTPIYEARRISGLGETRKAQLELQMHDLAERVSDPKDVFNIKSHG